MPKGNLYFQNDTGSSYPTSKMDFTIYDFAHRDIAISNRLRCRKLDTINWKKMSGDTKCLEAQHSKIETQESNIEVNVKKKKNKTKKFFTNKLIENWEETNYLKLPIDVWFIIGRYIRPEDVAAFGAICNNSLLVVRSSSFWKHLYLRFYKETNELPKCLELKNIERCHGLKSRVVRSLYHFYDPFVDRLKVNRYACSLDCLIGMRCIQMWSKQIRMVWHYFFTFQKANANLYKVKENLLSEVNVLHNNEESNIVLEILSNQYLPLQSAHSLILIKGITSGLKTNKLMLYFNPCFCIPNKTALDNSIVLILDPIVRMLIMPWWDPLYPY